MESVAVHRRNGEPGLVTLPQGSRLLWSAGAMGGGANIPSPLVLPATPAFHHVWPPKLLFDPALERGLGFTATVVAVLTVYAYRLLVFHLSMLPSPNFTIPL